MSGYATKAKSALTDRKSARELKADLGGPDQRFAKVPKADSRTAKSHLVAALVQAGALLINHIAPGNRTLAPSA
jgi:hypothetical protein